MRNCYNHCITPKGSEITMEEQECSENCISKYLKVHEAVGKLLYEAKQRKLGGQLDFSEDSDE